MVVEKDAVENRVKKEENLENTSDQQQEEQQKDSEEIHNKVKLKKHPINSSSLRDKNIDNFLRPKVKYQDLSKDKYWKLLLRLTLPEEFFKKMRRFTQVPEIAIMDKSKRKQEREVEDWDNLF